MFGSRPTRGQVRGLNLFGPSKPNRVRWLPVVFSSNPYEVKIWMRRAPREMVRTCRGAAVIFADHKVELCQNEPWFPNATCFQYPSPPTHHRPSMSYPSRESPGHHFKPGGGQRRSARRSIVRNSMGDSSLGASPDPIPRNPPHAGLGRLRSVGGCLDESAIYNHGFGYKPMRG